MFACGYATSLTTRLDDDLVNHAYSNDAMSWGKRKAEAKGVVAIRRLVPVAVCRTRVPAVVDPGTAADNAVMARY